MSRQGDWAIWFGKGLSMAVLIPMAIFFTYKANNDSTVFNADMYKNLLMKMLGIRVKRSIASKEVILHDPDYSKAAEQLSDLNVRIAEYAKTRRLKSAPNVIKVFFRYHTDHVIEKINDGIFFYFRMWRFRLRLYRDLRIIINCNDMIIAEIQRIKEKEESMGY